MYMPQATDNIFYPESPWILLCGPTCIGKSYFRKAHKFYKIGSRMPEFKNVPKTVWTQPQLQHHTLVTTSNPKFWPTDWYSNEFVIKKIAIVLGAPYTVWQERVKIRGGDKSLITTSSFYNKYIAWIKNLKKYNILYILVDNRNNYPILEETDFLKMLV